MFKPQYVYIEEQALDYDLGRQLRDRFLREKVPIKMLKSNRVTGLPTNNVVERQRQGKNSLVISVRRSLKFQTCKPSAHYQLPLVTGCMGNCEYCYLQTRFSKQPFTKIYVNIDKILDKAQWYIEEREGITIFEGAAVSDPIPVEEYTQALAKSIEFFAANERARFTFVTKYDDVDSLLKLSHNRHTRIRFSLNLPSIIKKYEHRTPSLAKRIAAAQKLLKHDYPLGFIIAPIILKHGWQKNYGALLDQLAENFKESSSQIVLEIISHRFTLKAKDIILALHPDTELPLDESDRKFKYGQFGYGKYVYPKEKIKTMEEFFQNKVAEMGDNWSIKYII